jgi:hypothetical protein
MDSMMTLMNCTSSARESRHAPKGFGEPEGPLPVAAALIGIANLADRAELELADRSAPRVR